MKNLEIIKIVASTVFDITTITLAVIAVAQHNLTEATFFICLIILNREARK